MSEYWKSTPKYWCKHCKVFVRDTKLERTNHDATPRHQGNLKRFLRDLHRGHEKDEKDKERAKAEVARLNGITRGSGNIATAPSCSASSSMPKAGSKSTQSTQQVTPMQRKQHLAQLAEMGVAIPNEFRPSMAMAGEWQVTSQRTIDPEEEDKEPSAIALGVRKRNAEETDEEELRTKKSKWGSIYRTPLKPEEDADLDALLSQPIKKQSTADVGFQTHIKDEHVEDIQKLQQVILPTGVSTQREVLDFKAEPSAASVMQSIEPPPLSQPKHETDGHGVDGAGGVGEVVFKKRKAKNIRQK